MLNLPNSPEGSEVLYPEVILDNSEEGGEWRHLLLSILPAKSQYLMLIHYPLSEAAHQLPDNRVQSKMKSFLIVTVHLECPIKNIRS